MLRRAVLRGEIDLVEAANRLGDLQIDTPRKEELLDLWQFELDTTHKQIAAGKIVTLVGKGLLDISLARQRLINLGYQDPDAILLLTEAEQRIIGQEIAAIKAESKSARTAAKEIERAILKNAEQHARMQRQLCHTTPIAKLIKWYADYLIGDDYFVRRLTFCGYEPDVIEKYHEEARQERLLQSDNKRTTLQETAIEAGGGGI
jgi:hypothetical protein